MAHTNDGSPSRQVEETQVTKRPPRRIGAVVASATLATGGIGVTVGLATGAIEPDVTHAIVAVTVATVASVRYLMRRQAASVVQVNPKGNATTPEDVDKAA